MLSKTCKLHPGLQNQFNPSYQTSKTQRRLHTDRCLLVNRFAAPPAKSGRHSSTAAIEQSPYRIEQIFPADERGISRQIQSIIGALASIVPSTSHAHKPSIQLTTRHGPFDVTELNSTSVNLAESVRSWE